MSDTSKQLTLFPGEAASAESGSEQFLPHREQEPTSFRRVVVSPHLLAARRIAKKMHQIRDRDTETRAGLAICAQLKAYLAEDSTHLSPPIH